MKDVHKILILILCGLIGVGFAAGERQEYNKNWPTWRGPLATGEAPFGNPPLEFGEQKNVRWKIAIPGKGLSTPVIWGELVYITTAIELDKEASEAMQESQSENRPMWMRLAQMSETTEKFQRFVVYAIERKTGKIAWQKIVREEYPHEGRHRDGSWASNSCVTDGEHLIAFFGSFGVYCFDMAGNLIWEKDLGTMNISHTFGEGISPALYKNFLIINWDHENGSFIAALDKRTGKIIWEKDRAEKTSWSTPIVVEVNGAPQVIVAATNKSRSYDLISGELIWELGGLTRNVIPCPVAADGIVYLMSGFRGNMVQAIQLNKARGNLENSDALLWTLEENTPYVPSPLLYKGKLYYLKGNKESLTCTDAKTGTVHYTEQKLDGMKGVYASPVAAKDRIYIAGRNGVVFVLKHGTKFNVLAENSLDDKFDASPAIVDNELYLRGLKYLYCIAVN